MKEKQYENGNKLKPHLIKHTICLNDHYYTDHKDELEEVLQKLNKKLSSAGISLTADQQTMLQITIDDDKFRSVTVRRAGRKKKKSNKQLEEIRAYRKTHTAEETAKWLGLTRQTFYRKMRAHEQAGDSGDVEF